LVGSYTSNNFSGSFVGGHFEVTDPAVVGGGSVEAGSASILPRGGDLSQIAFGAHTTLGYSENKSDTGGTLTITDGTHAATIALLGNYMAASFVTAADGHGGTLITEGVQAVQQTLLTHPHA
jgi:hypothetical protein